MGHHCRKYGKVTLCPISTKIRLTKALVWPIAMHGSKSWTLRKNDAFEVKGLRKILRVSWTAKKTNVSVLNKEKSKVGNVRHCQARKLAYYGHTVRK